MTVQLETELKLKLVEPDMLGRLLESPLLMSLGVDFFTKELLEAQYYDTHHMACRSHSWPTGFGGGWSWLATLKGRRNFWRWVACREEYTVVFG